jgi:3-deoxy-D-manno-octulosonic-acid transferase
VPERGLVHVPQVLGEFEVALLVVGRHVEREGQQADHHALVGLRRVARNRHAVVGVDVAVHVGQGKLGFVNRGFECHKVCFFISGLGGNEPSIGTERRPVTPAERDLAGLAIVARP